MPDSLPPSLIAQIRSGNCVAFVGAGFSAAAGLPTWHGVLEQLAGEAPPDVRSHVAMLLKRDSAHALDEAAQCLEDTLGRARFTALLRDRFSAPKADAMRDRLRWLRGIPFRAILTTNFDTLLPGPDRGAEAYREVLRPVPTPWWRQVGIQGDSLDVPVVKLHGDVTRPGSIVFCRQDYRRLLYGDAGYREFLRAVLSNYPVLYLGFSFTDAYLNELRSESLSLVDYKEDDPTMAYAVVNDAPELTQRHFAKHEGMKVLSFETRGRDYSGFDRILQGLFEETNPSFHFGTLLAGKRLLWLDPKPENNEEVQQFLSVAKASAASGLKPFETVQALTPEEALRHLGREGAQRFDLVLTHWGDGKAPGEASNAEKLLRGLRRVDHGAPVVVFAGRKNVEERKRRALALGAQAYTHSYEGLLRAIERVLEPVSE